MNKPIQQMQTFLESPAILTTPMAPENTADKHKSKKTRWAWCGCGFSCLTQPAYCEIGCGCSGQRGRHFSSLPMPWYISVIVYLL